MTKLHQRTAARQGAVQVLYTGEIQGESPADLLKSEDLLVSEAPLSSYAESLVTGVVENMEAIDARLVDASENWSLDRMSIVDRSILRVAVYEMEYVEAVPVSVAINEAVDLAKQFGGEDESPSFVNGILGRIAKALEAEGKVPATEEPVEAE